MLSYNKWKSTWPEDSGSGYGLSKPFSPKSTVVSLLESASVYPKAKNEIDLNVGDGMRSN